VTCSHHSLSRGGENGVTDCKWPAQCVRDHRCLDIHVKLSKKLYF